jgi:hypothetical protein
MIKLGKECRNKFKKDKLQYICCACISTKRLSNLVNVAQYFSLRDPMDFISNTRWMLGEILNETR